jgi:transposase-like protein
LVWRFLFTEVAVEEVYPAIPHQLCWVHKFRNIAKYCPKRYREECSREATQIRRRLKVMGCFQDSKSCKRIVVSLFEYFNKKWSKRIHRIKDITEYYLEVA